MVPPSPPSSPCRNYGSIASFLRLHQCLPAVTHWWTLNPSWRCVKMLYVCVGRSQSAHALPCRSMPEPAPIRAWCCMTGWSPAGAVSHHEFYPLGNMLGSQLNQPGSAKISLCRASHIIPCPCSSCHTPSVHATPLSTHTTPSLVNATPLHFTSHPLGSCHTSPLMPYFLG